MKPQHHRLNSPDPSRTEATRRRNARLHVFLVAHAAAVVLLYAAAVHLGGGLASTPFPPDQRAAASPARSPEPPLPSTAFVPDARPGSTPASTRHALVLPTAAPDVEPPWAASPAFPAAARLSDR